jgi:hypothetical protein
MAQHRTWAPTLFFGPEQVTALREEAQGRKAALWRRVLAAAERRLKEPVPQEDLSKPWAAYLSCASERLSIVRSCSLAYLMTGREEFHRRARQEVEAILEWESWIDPCHERQGRKYGLMTGIVSTALAHYLDWCGSAVSEEERASVADHFRRKAVEPLLHDMALPASFFKDSVNNWVAVMTGGAGLMSLLLMEEQPGYADLLEKCVFHLRRYLNWANDDGSTDEGGGYWAFGMGNAAILLDALRVNADRLPARLKWQSAGELHRFPALAATAYFPLYCIQGAQYVVDFGDTRIEDAGRMQPLFAWFAGIWRNGHFQWLCDRIESDDPLGFVWYDPTVEAVSPADLPTSKSFHGAGWGIMRSDLDDERGFLLAVRAGHNAKTHRHYDLGTIILRAGGRGLIIDAGHPGYSADYWAGKPTYARDTIGHNCILVDGEGQQDGARDTAEITCLEDLGDTKHLTVEVRCPDTGIELHRRQMTVELSGNTSGKLTLCDEVSLARSARVTWLFHFEQDAELRGNAVVISNGGVKLTMTVPARTPVEVLIERDYPVPFVSIRTTAAAEAHSLEMHCEIEA